MVSLEDIRRRRQEILSLAAKHGARNVRIFGSLARDEAKAGSDIDLLVKLDDACSLIDHIALIRDLEELLGCPVDVVSEDALDRVIRTRVLTEGVPL